MNPTAKVPLATPPRLCRNGEVTVIMVSYNTRELTLRAIETLLEQAGDVAMRVIVWDNASQDGSARAIAERFPEIETIAHGENLGFAEANNRVAAMADSEWLLLLNPDTETHPRAVEALLAFGKANPGAGIVGGRTVYPDGTLNIGSCWNRMSPWSLFCSAFGIHRMFSSSETFNSEAIGDWKRDSVRHVDIVVGCFFLLRRELWVELGGFNARYNMYGEEADMCLRAAALGYRPMITPEAQIMHVLGAASKKREDKTVRLLRAKATLIRDHWPKSTQSLGVALLALGIANRYAAARIKALLGRKDSLPYWRNVWDQRADWIAGYPQG